MPRPSPVTDEVRRLFDAQERHAWSLDELLASVRSSLGSADYSSVFRAVSQFEREGVLDKIDLGDGKARYEMREDHHEHIRCERCGRVEEVPVCVLDDAAVQVHSLTGFKVTSHQVVFGGLCRECATRDAAENVGERFGDPGGPDAGEATSTRASASDRA